MKKFKAIAFIAIIALIVWQKDWIVKVLVTEFIYKYSTTEVTTNAYHKNDEYLLFQDTTNFEPKSKDEFNNIIYTILNNGMDKFSFFCDFDYKECADDFTKYVRDYEDIEVINNYVNPFNSFDHLSVTVDSFNRITVEVDKLYQEQEIEITSKTIDDFIKKNINNNMSDHEKIKLFHDYIINNTKYDSNFKLNTDKDTYPTHPYSAYGLLVEQKAICSGYSDSMAIYLDKIGIKNYKISSKQHIWNYVYLDGKWYHLDLTWDDPVNDKNIDMLTYDFFLITTDELEKKKTGQHDYNKDIYIET